MKVLIDEVLTTRRNVHLLWWVVAGLGVLHPEIVPQLL
jgi:hypothetical protein